MNKNELLVDQVELLDAKPQYARIRYPGGREDTVSLGDQALAGDEPGPTGLSEGLLQTLQQIMKKQKHGLLLKITRTLELWSLKW